MRYLSLVRNVNNWQDYFLYKFGIRRCHPLVFHCKNNVVATVPHRLVHTFKEIFFEEYYTRYLPIGLLSDGITVVDVGANAGYFSLYMLSRFPRSRIVAFEPIPKNFELLAEQRERNSGYDFTIANKAVHGTSGRITLRYDAGDSYTTGASIFDNALGQDEIEVCATTVPEIFETYSLQKVDVLKLDCEGAEYQILYTCPGEYLNAVKCVALESHQGRTGNENKAAVAAFLASSGYTVRTDGGNLVWAWRRETEAR